MIEGFIKYWLNKIQFKDSFWVFYPIYCFDKLLFIGLCHYKYTINCASFYLKELKS